MENNNNSNPFEVVTSETFLSSFLSKEEPSESESIFIQEGDTLGEMLRNMRKKSEEIIFHSYHEPLSIELEPIGEFHSNNNEKGGKNDMKTEKKGNDNSESELFSEYYISRKKEIDKELEEYKNKKLSEMSRINFLLIEYINSVQRMVTKIEGDFQRYKNKRSK